MQEAEARRTLGLLRTELDEARTAAAAAAKRAASIEKLVEGYIELFPSLAEELEGEAVASLDPDRPRGQEAVRRVLRDNPGKWYTVMLMTRELKERGWLPESEQPQNAVRTALTRVAETFPNVRRGLGEKTHKITFAWFPDSEPGVTPGSQPGSPQVIGSGSVGSALLFNGQKPADQEVHAS